MTDKPGVCAVGTTYCDGDLGVRCRLDIEPSNEICDGLDNDCDGRIDEGDVGQGQDCSTGESGVCGVGTTSCDGELGVRCRPDIEPSDELCDGLDNDCNGQTDEGDVGQGQHCMTDEPGVCGVGTTSCDGELGVRCRPDIEPSDETCDGLDNDCDGQIDEGYVGQDWRCVTDDPSVCMWSTTYCDGESGLRCRSNAEPSAETCDGLDNNCNGEADEGDVGQGQHCATDQPGVCAAGTTYCGGELGVLCSRNVAPSSETCDGLDNDCDGLIDEGDVGQRCLTEQPSICIRGTTYCDGEFGLRCRSNAEPSAEICDGRDNDCDGLIDEGDLGQGQDCELDVLVGNCDNSGTIYCEGRNGLQCRPATIEVCDGLDNDCDGQVDNVPIFTDRVQLDQLDTGGSHRHIPLPRIVWNGNVYGVAWHNNGGLAFFATISDDNFAVESIIQLNRNSVYIEDLVWTGDCFLVALSDYPTNKLIRIHENGEELHVIIDSPDRISMALGINDETVGLAYLTPTHREIIWVGNPPEPRSPPLVTIVFETLSLNGGSHSVGQEIGSGNRIFELHVAWDGNQYGVLWKEQQRTGSPYFNVFFSIVPSNNEPVEPPLQIALGVQLGTIDLTTGGLGQFLITYASYTPDLGCMTTVSVEDGVVGDSFGYFLCEDTRYFIYGTEWNEQGLDVLWTSDRQTNLSRFSNNNNELHRPVAAHCRFSGADFVSTTRNYTVIYLDESNGLFVERGPLGCATVIPCADCEQD